MTKYITNNMGNTDDIRKKSRMNTFTMQNTRMYFLSLKPKMREFPTNYGCKFPVVETKYAK